MCFYGEHKQCYNHKHYNPCYVLHQRHPLSTGSANHPHFTPIHLPVEYSTSFIIHVLFFSVNNYLWGTVLLPHPYQNLTKGVQFCDPFLGPPKSPDTFFTFSLLGPLKSLNRGYPLLSIHHIIKQAPYHCLRRSYKRFQVVGGYFYAFIAIYQDIHVIFKGYGVAHFANKY